MSYRAQSAVVTHIDMVRFRVRQYNLHATMVFAESRSTKLAEKAVSKINFVKYQITQSIYHRDSEVGTKTFM